MNKLVVIIPAYNEENVILKTLKPYEELASPNLKVVVVCNGCTDNTYAEACKAGGGVEVYNREVGSKVLAINFAIASLEKDVAFDVFVQDADVIIDKDSILSLISYSSSVSEFSFASIKPNLELQSASYFVHCYYKFLTQTPAYKKGMVSSGCYLVSSKKIYEIFPFPEVIADDGYVKAKLGPKNIQLIPDAIASVKVPKDIWSLIKIKTRSKLGNVQLKTVFSVDPVSGDNGFLNLLKEMIIRRDFLPFFIYSTVTLICIIRARIMFYNSNFIWEKDESSR